MQNLTETGSATGSAPGGGFTVPGTAIGGTAGSVLFINPDNTVTQDNSNFYYNSTNKWLGLGTIPAAKLHEAGNFSSAAWTTNGILIRQDAATVTDTTSSGTVSFVYVNNFGVVTVAASAATTFTQAFGTVFTTPVAGTNVTIPNSFAALSQGRFSVNSASANAFVVGTTAGNATAFGVDGTNGRIGIGLGTAPTGKVHIGGNQSAAAWTTAGIGIRSGAATYTDTSSSGTVAFNGVHVLSQPTLAASSATTFTDSATLYIPSAPTNGTNATLTNKYALYLGDRLRSNGTVTNLVTITAATYSILVTDDTVRLDTTSNNINVTLPTPSTVTGQVFVLKRISGGANTITLTGTIDGSTNSTTFLVAQYSRIVIQSNGTSYDQIG